jgi:hypothetical protein
VHRPLDGVASDGRQRLDVVATILLSVAALATSWAGFQASVWNGDQSTYGARATALRTSATRASTRAGQERIIDVLLFSGWLNAYVHDDARLAGFYERRFRPEFVPVFRVWTASRPLRSLDAAPSPFVLPEYRLAGDAEAQQLARAADEASAASQHANAMSDSYVFDAVILATVMFFASTAQRGTTRTRRILLAIAMLMCATGLYRLFTSLVAWPA